MSAANRASNESHSEVDEIANAILGSESFLWLMCGSSDWTEGHLEAIRPAWHRWVEAGGRPWGRL